MYGVSQSAQLLMYLSNVTVGKSLSDDETKIVLGSDHPINGPSLVACSRTCLMDTAAA